MKKVFFQKEPAKSLSATKCTYIKLPETIVVVTCSAVVYVALLGQAQAAGI